MPTERQTEPQPVPGRPPKHGARALARHLAAGTLDRRTWIAREKASLLDAVGADAGGWAHLNARERFTAEIGVDAVLICRAIVNQAFGNGLFEQGPDGLRLMPAVAKGLATYQGVATRAFTALGMHPDVVDRLPTLEQYLAKYDAPAASPAPATPTPAAGVPDVLTSPADAAEVTACSVTALPDEAA